MTPLERLFDRLGNGWETAGSLCKEFGWQPHSLRGRISNVSVKFKVKVERQRIDGVTSYRIAPAQTDKFTEAAE